MTRNVETQATFLRRPVAGERSPRRASKALQIWDSLDCVIVMCVVPFMRNEKHGKESKLVQERIKKHDNNLLLDEEATSKGTAETRLLVQHECGSTLYIWNHTSLPVEERGGICERMLGFIGNTASLLATDSSLLKSLQFQTKLIEGIVTIAKEVKAAFNGAPQDIEGVFVGGKFTVVQSRPQIL
jgi:hypothetical protein